MKTPAVVIRKHLAGNASSADAVQEELALAGRPVVEFSSDG